MNEEENQSLSVLLPDAGVGVYSRHQDTLQAVRQIAQDWRFARVRITAEEGDVTTAAASYKASSSPDLVIVQTDTIDDSFPQQLADLAGNCDENTSAIVIGPVNDVNLYRKLIDMGVSDYLVQPVESKTLANVIAKALIDKKGATGSNLIGFVGAKGGVGVSTLAVASAWAVSDLLGQKTVLLDAAGGWSTQSVSVGFEPSTTISTAARAAGSGDEDSIKRMLFKAGEKFSVLATGSDALLGSAATEAQLESLIDLLMQKYPVVIVDLSQATPEVMRAVISRANHIVVVSTPTLPSLRLARSLIHEMKELRGKAEKSINMILNMQGLAAGNEVSRKDIEPAIDFKISAVVPFAPKAFMGSESQSKKLLDDKDGHQIVTESLLPVLEKMLDVHAEIDEDAGKASSGFLGSLLGKVKSRK